MTEVEQGSTELFDLIVKSAGALVDLDELPDVQVLRPDLSVAATGTGTRLSLGRYRYAFTAVTDAPIGEGWSIVWTGEAASVPVTGEEIFSVVEPETASGLLATVAELELFLDDDLDRARAELFLLIASGEVRGATGNEFSLVRGDVVLLNGTGAVALVLPQAPVLDVTEVLEAPGRNVELELAGPEADRPSYEWSESGVLRRIDGNVFARRFRYYRVTLDHGFETTPDDVRGVVLRCAARGFENPEGLRQETLGRYSYTLAGEQAGIGLYGPDVRALEPYMIGTKMRAGSAASGSGS